MMHQPANSFHETNRRNNFSKACTCIGMFLCTFETLQRTIMQQNGTKRVVVTLQMTIRVCSRGPRKKGSKRD